LGGLGGYVDEGRFNKTYRKAKFHCTGGGGMPIHNIIYDNADFALWKHEVQIELQDI